MPETDIVTGIHAGSLELSEKGNLAIIVELVGIGVLLDAILPG